MLLLLLGGGARLPAAAADSLERLERLHSQISRKFPAVSHLSADQLTQTLANPGAVLFDVREEAEYRVSHLRGAIRVDPDIGGAAFWSRYRELIGDKDVVLYCSVGHRSSKLAARLQPAAAGRGRTVRNLAQGIFGWHNSRLPLFRGGDRSDRIHPYSRRWESYLTRRDRISYE